MVSETRAEREHRRWIEDGRSGRLANKERAEWIMAQKIGTRGAWLDHDAGLSQHYVAGHRPATLAEALRELEEERAYTARLEAEIDALLAKLREPEEEKRAKSA